MHRTPTLPLRLATFAFSILLLVGPAPEAECAAAALFQDELIRVSDAIAVVDILNRTFPDITGIVLHGRTEFPTSLILYQSKVVQSISGEIPSQPLIIQFEGAGDLNALEKGRYVLFLKAEGHLFTPIATDFRVDDGDTFWFTKPFLTGGNGPEMGKVPLSQAISEIKALLEKYKKS